MTKTEYLESQRGKPYSVIIAEQPKETAIGSIRGDNLRNVVAILAGGLQYRLDTAADSFIRTALLTAFKYMTLPDYAINLSLQENLSLLDNAVAMGLVTPQERSQFLDLASYSKPIYNLTAQDCLEYFGNPLPSVTTNSPTISRSYIFHLFNELPEESYVMISYRAMIGNVAGPWIMAAQFAIHKAKAYSGYCAVIPQGSEVKAESVLYPISAELKVL